MWDATHKKKDGSYVNEEFRKKLVHSYHISFCLYIITFSPLGIHKIISWKTIKILKPC